MPEKIKEEIQFEIDQIEHLLEIYAGVLDRAEMGEPELVELTAVASVLHSFYNGIENIFMTVAKGVDHQIPEGLKWHRDLLKQMARKTQERKPVLSKEVSQKLLPYLGFRHFYRHSYSFYLDWNELEKLVLPLREIWQQIRIELQCFIKR